MSSFKVGMTRFELATPRPPDVYATRLRYIPNDVFKTVLLKFSTTGNFFRKLQVVQFTLSLSKCYIPNYSYAADSNFLFNNYRTQKLEGKNNENINCGKLLF